MRIDKALWCFRIFKTRGLAKDACDKGRVLVNHKEVKPSQDIGPGDKLQVKQKGYSKMYQVLDIPKSRLGAKLLFQYITDVTPQEELDKLAAIHEANKQYPYIKGRPTKRDFRHLRNYMTSHEEE